MRRCIARFTHDAAGVDLVEYALLAGVLVMASVIGVNTIGTSIAGFLGGVGGYLGTLATR